MIFVKHLSHGIRAVGNNDDNDDWWQQQHWWKGREMREGEGGRGGKINQLNLTLQKEGE